MKLGTTDVQILATIVAATVTVVGWFVTKHLERKMKRAEFRRAYIQRQIEEFYGPLYSLIWQIFSGNRLKHKILSRCPLDSSEHDRVNRYFAEQYFLPLHSRVKAILETKLYLVEGTAMPESIFSYLNQSLQEDTQHNLWSLHGVSTIAVKGSPFPQSFFDTIESTLKSLMVEYEVNVQVLKTGVDGRFKSTPVAAGAITPTSVRKDRIIRGVIAENIYADLDSSLDDRIPFSDSSITSLQGLRSWFRRLSR